jgi:NADPH:quinone reductase-like Zn-dependent oxidoreductase
MKAVVVDGAGPVEESPLQWRDVEDVTPGPGEVATEVAACRACRSNLIRARAVLVP